MSSRSAVHLDHPQLVGCPAHPQPFPHRLHIQGIPRYPLEVDPPHLGPPVGVVKAYCRSNMKHSVLGREWQLGTEPRFPSYVPKNSPYTTCIIKCFGTNACLKCRFLGSSSGLGKSSLGDPAQGRCQSLRNPL